MKRQGKPVNLNLENAVNLNRGDTEGNRNRDGIEDIISRRQKLGNLNLDDLEKLEDLGSGNFGSVSKVQHKDSGLVMARKVISFTAKSNERTLVMRELEILNACNSPYIVGYFGAVLQDNEIILLMEYMDAKSLDSIIVKTKHIPENIIGKIAISVSRGLTYLKDTIQIMHRDVKPSNILLNSDGQIKLCDFGISRRITDSIATTFIGTSFYMAPERLRGENYTVQSDIWSLGLTLVEAALGVYPIPQSDPLDMYLNGRNVTELSAFELMDVIAKEPPPTIPGPPYFTQEFKDFIDKCLRENANDRFDLDSVYDHAFMRRAEDDDVDVGNWVCDVWRNQ